MYYFSTSIKFFSYSMLCATLGVSQDSRDGYKEKSIKIIKEDIWLVSRHFRILANPCLYTLNRFWYFDWIFEQWATG